MQNGIIIPLDGKTQDSSKFQDCKKVLHHEIKTTIDKTYQYEWNQLRKKILLDIAVLLKENYPNEHKVSDQQHLNNIVDKLDIYICNLPVKIGRPPKKQNPFTID